MLDPAHNLEERVRERLNSLTKPPGSLGQLEDIAVRFALIREEEMPSPARKGLYIFCGDHGVTEEGVSRYPQSVTRQMVRNFLDGGAAINVLCRRLQIRPVVVDMGVCGASIPGVVDRKIADGTSNFARVPAMTRDQAERALQHGSALAEEAATQYDVVGLGEMGIGNTTAASAILSVYSSASPYETVGPGSGLDSQGVRRKAELIEKALALHKPSPGDPLGVLAAVGGFEFAGIAGFLIRACRLKLPVVLDGFPCCAGALIAKVIEPLALQTAFFSHESREPGHRRMLVLLEAKPYFNLGLRLGEGTGAALCMGIIDSAVRLYREMATFNEAGISGPSSGELG
ncbi:MAG TPA: nicotinate-nucleotide--dimethylbenzimidazole phosphoribosyltransferase [Bryobacteraceae bacterium]|nr:nicotinate-nucleotide--dimethylbenzimidazole phosphoribosyltransferase [Bryobacteraceae bacterium]